MSKDQQDEKESNRREQTENSNCMPEDPLEKAEFLEKVTNNLPAIVYLFDIQELEMIWCNETHQALIGFDSTGMDLVNEQGDLRAISKDDQDLAVDNIKGWRDKKNIPSQVIIRITDRENNDQFFITDHYVYKRDESGHPKWVLGVGVNISNPADSEHERRILYSENILETQRLLDEMSERELEVLEHLSEGKSYDAIASEMNLSVDGIRYHIRNIYSKLEVNTRAKAIKIALKYRLIIP